MKNMVFKGVLVFLAVAWAVSAQGLEVDVPAGSVTDRTTAIGSGESSLVKKGEGRLNLKLGTTKDTFAGSVTVKEGTLGMDSPANLGTPSSIVVEKGATLDASALEGNTSSIGVTGGSITLAGSGYNAQGALRRASGGVQDSLIRGFVLADDAVVYNATRIGVNSGTMNFNGHVFEKTGGGELLLLGGTWQSAGGIVVNGGQLTLQNKATYDGAAENVLVGKSGTLTLWNSPGHGSGPRWTLALSNNFTLATGSTAANAHAWDGPVTVPADKTLTVNAWGNPSEITLGGSIDCKGTLKKQGGNSTLYLRGGAITNNFLSIEGGSVRVQGDGTGRHKFGQITTANAYGSLSLENAGYVHKPDGTLWVAGNGNNINTVTITNTVLDGWYTSTHATTFSLGNDAGYNGRLIVEAGAVVSNRLCVGNSGRGAVYQRGGDVYWQVQSGSQYEFFGGRGYGYYGLDAGTLYANNWLALGIWSHAAHGIYVQKGGSARFTSLTIGSMGHGEFYVGGGTTTCGSLTVGSDGDYGGLAGSGTITVTDGGFLDLGKSKLTPTHSNGFVCVVNLNAGGRLKCSRMNTGGIGTAHGSEVHYCFNGGVICPSTAWGFTDQWNASVCDPTRATVYDGGITVDASACAADNADSRFPFPLQRPYGRGVKSITLPSADSPFWSKNFLGPTRVRISGAGKAATAIVEFDHGTKKPVGVKVTGVGFGYDEETTATVDAWDGSESYPCAVETFEHSCTGGLKLVGAMGLTLVAANTWGGPTTVAGGTLTFETAQSYPAESPLVLRPAGTVNFNNIARTLPSITGAGLVKNANLTVTNGLAFYAADANTNAFMSITGRLTLGAGARLTVLDPENLDYHVKPRLLVAKANGGIEGAIPVLAGTSDPRWRAIVSGNAVYVYFPIATTLILR